MATGKLREVEEDATRIQEKRFKEQLEEQQYQREKHEAALAPAKKETLPEGGETYEPEVKKGK